MDLYEKKYKEVLERAREALNDGTISSNTIAYLQDIFPELKESKDEKIRKWIIEGLEVTISSRYMSKNFVDKAKDAIAWLEKQGEQKPTNKVEPKFKVGDWLVHKDLVGVARCIIQIHAPHYYLTNNNSFIKFGEEDNYRPWTIQDAKDGDVLACKNGWTCIFNCLNDNLFNSHCFMDSEGWFYKYGGQGHTLDKRICGEINPATKEQRDLLFQKIKEAGYEWDADKKELKKIEHNTVEWSKDDEKMQAAIHIYLDWLDGRKEVAPRGEYSIRDMISWILKLKP